MKIKAQGYKDLDEAWVRWFLFDRSEVGTMSDNEIKEELGMFKFYEGVGQAFGYTPIIRRVKERILVTQLCGLDI